MNIIDRFKKWFFQEEKVGLISIGDIIQIPGREYYKDDIAKLRQIDIYKEEYLKILSKRKLISSNQISFDNLEKEFLMHIELILNLSLNIEQEAVLEDYEKHFKERINMLKLQLYLNEINNMESETIEKLIALEELQKGKRIPIVNRQLLNEKINSLKMILLSFRNQKVAISIEIKNYFMILNNNLVSYQENNTCTIKKYQQVFDIARQFIDENTLYNIGNLKIDYLAKIALIERELEIYVYLHKKDIENLRHEIANMRDIPKTVSNKSIILKHIDSIEKKYYIFEEYGRGIITHTILYELYKLKFDILTCDINYLEKTPFEFINSKTELNYYEEIIGKKFERIILGKNEFINAIYDDKANKAIKEIAFYLKGRNNYIKSILDDKLKLALLLAFEKKDGLILFFNQNMLSEEDASTKFNVTYLNYKPEFLFAEKLPLDSCFQIMKAQEKSKKQDSISYDNPLYKLYKLTKGLSQYSINNNNDVYDLPEGIIKINVPNIYSTTPLIKYLNEKSLNNVVILPSTLEEISGHVFYDLTKPTLIMLNNGLKKIGKYALCNITMEHLYLPSSIELIEEEALNYKGIKWLYFTDFENSKLLHDKAALRKLIKELFYVRPISRNTVLEEVHNGIYRECVNVAINTNLRAINLHNSNGKQILVIDARKLEITKKRFRRTLKPPKNRLLAWQISDNWKYAQGVLTLKNEDVEDILERLQSIIKEEIGYDLEYTTHKEKAKKIIKK